MASNPRFLESSSNLKTALTRALGRTPSTLCATDVATCLEQGRLFFEAARSAPLEIQPLITLYGVIAYSKALICGRRLVPASTLAQTHGVTDTSKFTSKLADLKIRVDNRGTFQEFMDTISELDFVQYYGAQSEPRRKFFQSDQSDKIRSKEFGFHDIFSRIFSLRELYEETFDRPAHTNPCTIFVGSDGVANIRLSLKDRSNLSLDELKEIVAGLRSEYSFLEPWVFCSCSRSYGALEVAFANIAIDGIDDFPADRVVEVQSGWFERTDYQKEQMRDFEEILPPICGALSTGGLGYTKPVNGVRVSQEAFTYLGAFMLGSLVRYRPQTWIHSLRSRSTEKRPTDDEAIALVEKFLRSTLDGFPDVISTALTVRREDE